jgi:hypothetical protein
LVWRLCAKPKPVTSDPAELWDWHVWLHNFNANRLAVVNKSVLTFSHQKRRGNVQCVL